MSRGSRTATANNVYFSTLQFAKLSWARGFDKRIQSGQPQAAMLKESGGLVEHSLERLLHLDIESCASSPQIFMSATHKSSLAQSATSLQPSRVQFDSSAARQGQPLRIFLAYACYLFLILFRLDSFPLYFFCDEAIHALEAQSLISRGADLAGRAWPLFVRGFGDYQWSASIYLQIPFNLLFGATEFAVRLRSVCFSLLALWFLLLISKDFARGEEKELPAERTAQSSVSAWFVPLVLATSPIWIIVSRTGFENMLAEALFLGFIFFLGKLPVGSKLELLLCAGFGALAFYAYAPTRGWVVLTLLFTVVLAPKTALSNWRRWTIFAAAFAITLIPFLRVALVDSAQSLKRLQSLGLAAFLTLPLKEQILKVAAEFGAALNPLFWFTWSGTQNTGPYERHLLPQMGLLSWLVLPFFVSGLVALFTKRRSFQAKVLLASFLAAPLPAAVIEHNSLRCLHVGIVYLLIGVFGAERLLGGARSGKNFKPPLGVSVFVGSVLYALLFGAYVFFVAPTHYKNYGFYGVQYGAPQVFGWIKNNASRFSKFEVAHDLFNAGEIFEVFYLPQELRARVRIGEFADLCKRARRFSSDEIYLASVDAIAALSKSGCPLRFKSEWQLGDPAGRGLIEAVTVEALPSYADWIEQQNKTRKELQYEKVIAAGRELKVGHTRFDIGSAADIFDDSSSTLARSAHINPLELRLSGELDGLVGVQLVVRHSRVKVSLSADTNEGPVVWQLTDTLRAGELTRLKFVSPPGAEHSVIQGLEISVEIPGSDEYECVHLNELALDFK